MATLIILNHWSCTIIHHGTMAEWCRHEPWPCAHRSASARHVLRSWGSDLTLNFNPEIPGRAVARWRALWGWVGSVWGSAWLGWSRLRLTLTLRLVGGLFPDRWLSENLARRYCRWRVKNLGPARQNSLWWPWLTTMFGQAEPGFGSDCGVLMVDGSKNIGND